MRRSWQNRWTWVGLGICTVLAAGPVWGASSVLYTLQLGGNNHAADVKAGNYVMFTPGNPAEGELYQAGNPLTWSVALAADGIQGTGPGAGSRVNGAANFVFDLELHQGTETGPIVNQQVFYSSIHDGGSGCVPSGGNLPNAFCPPCLAGAAFAHSFNPWGNGPGRVLDAPQPLSLLCPPYPNIPQGGVNMDVFLFPTVEPGKLLGMGAGYHQWKRSGGGSTFTVHGVGRSDILGVVPVCEGQINTTGLAAGTYTLKLIPKSGTNVLRGDIDIYQNQNAFSVGAEQVTGDTITFTLGDVPPPTLVSAVARAYQGEDYSIFDLNLPLISPITTSDPREYGPYWFILTLSEPVVVTDGSLDLGDEVVLSTGTDASVALIGDNNDQIEIILNALIPDRTCLGITLSGLENLKGVALGGDKDVHVRALYGDVDGNGVVNGNDLAGVKGQLFKSVTADNCRYDVTVDKIINGNDLSAVKSNIFKTVVCP